MSRPKYQRFHFCPKCGGRLEYRYKQDAFRLTCISCDYCFYENPVVGVAGIVMNEEKQILLGRRKAEKYAGLWCIPCGYVEYYEDVYDAVKREFKEECCLDIDVDKIFTVQSNFHDSEIHTVGIWFLVRITGGTLKAGEDLDQLAYFDLDNPPELAFPTDRKTLKLLQTNQGTPGAIPPPSY